MIVVGAALAGQVHEEPVGLAEAVSPAVAAVVIQLDTPASVPVKIPVAAGCEPYAYRVWRGTVTDVVAGPVPKGAAINVFPGDTPDLVEMSRAACLDGMIKSPLFSSYPGVPPIDGARLLVVLRWVPPYGWVESVAGAWLPPSSAPEVKAKMAARSWSPEKGTEEILCVRDADCGGKRECRETRCK
ncbi:MAG: hypothetical protein ACOZNI_17485 [Myxococcota bacterium]